MAALSLIGAVPRGDAFDAPISRIAFGSCAFQWLEQPIWDAVLDNNPDLFLFLGDAIYGDFDGLEVFEATEQSLLTDWGKLASKPGFAALRERVPVMATWDNHDYGHHNAGSEFPLKETSRKVFLDFFREPGDSMRRIRDGIFDAQVFGVEGRRIQVILLDTRWNRSELIEDPRTEEQRASLGLVGSMGHIPNDDPGATLLGEAQWFWLEEQLKVPAEIRLICSGIQVVNDAKGMQEWGNFPVERERLYELIERTEAKGVVFLSGNVHYSEISLSYDGPYPFYDFTSSGLTHNNQSYAAYENPDRVTGPYAENSFGMVVVHWDASPAPEIIMRIVGLDGAVKMDRTISLAGLQ